MPRSHSFDGRRIGWPLVAALAATALFSPVATSAAQTTTLVAGVADATNGHPIEDAEVVLPQDGRAVRTDWLGEARVSGIAPGVHRVRVRHVGFSASDIMVSFTGDSVGVVFMLQPVPKVLDTMYVRARAVADRYSGFEERRRAGIGHFLTSWQLAQAGLEDFPLVAQEHFPGLQVLAGRGGFLQLATLRSSCGTDTTYEVLPTATSALLTAHTSDIIANGGSGTRVNAGAATASGSCFSNHPCHVKLFLDDVPLAETDVDIVRTWDLYGVEYYPAGNAPPQYQTSGAACGVMLLWSK